MLEINTWQDALRLESFKLSKKKPIVGISANVMLDESGRFQNFWRSYVNEDYVISVLKAGGVPIILPVINDEKCIREQLENVDAIIVTGGDADVNPSLYGEELLPKSSAPNGERDWFDFKMAKIVEEIKIPTLNICRGHQVSNVFHGGTLYQDTSYADNINLVHNQYSTPDFLAHELKIQKSSLLYDILKKDKIWVNSFHHQIINEVAETFKVTAVATDGAIEAIEYKNPDYFFLSLQWHPEMMTARGDEDMLKIFKRLINETKI